VTLYFQDDQTVLGRLARQETARAYRSAATAQAAQDPGWVRLLNDYLEAYPEMDAETAIGFAKAGILPNSEEAQQAAQHSVEQHKSKSIIGRIGDVISPVAKAVGKVTHPLARAADTALGGVDETLAPVVRGAVRTGFVALETPLQEIQTYLRANIKASVEQFKDIKDAGDVGRWALNPLIGPKHVVEYGIIAGSSSGRETVDDIISGRKVDLGSGFLPGGQVEEDVKRKANQLTLNVGNVQLGGPGNPSISAGRVLAAFVSEPGSTPFKIISGLGDAGVAWFGDPSTAVGNLAKEAELSTRLERSAGALRDDGLKAAVGEIRTPPSFSAIDEAGRVPGVRNTVIPDVADAWLQKGGRRVVEKIAEEGDFYKLWEATKRKLPIDMTVRLADATSPDEVMNVLRPAIGAELNKAPEFLGFKARRSYTQGFRLKGEMPSAFLDPRDLGQATEQMDRWLRNAKVSPELRNAAVEKIARSPGREAMVPTLDEIMGDVAVELTSKKRPLMQPIDAKRARDLTKLANQDIDKTRNYFIDEIAENRKAAGVISGGSVLDLQSPHLFTEYLDSVVPMHDARELRRATSDLARLVDNPFFERTVGAIDSIQGKWKQMALLRGAYTVRVIGEEQVRMAAAGLDSMFSHPLSFISSLIADPEASRKFLRGRMRQSDALGERFFSDIGEAVPVELRNSLNHGWAGWAGDEVFDRNYRIFKPGDDGYERAWAQAIGEMHSDPVARKIAEAKGNLRAVSDWYWDGTGANLRKRLVTDKPELASRAGADQYLATTLEGLGYRTAGDPRLMDVIATGKIADKAIGKLNEHGRWKFSDEMSSLLGDIPGPQAVKGQAIVQSSKTVNAWDNATGWAFSHLMTKPTNYLSRSSSFRQFYWDRIEEMAPFMDDVTRTKVIANAEGVVDAKQLARIAGATPNKTKTIVHLADADHLAKVHALDSTKWLLYDLTEKGQFFDAARLVFPFGEAWKEVVTRWAAIGAENPNVFRRGQQIVTSARGAGVFHKDVNGEEVFTYPFSRHLAKAVTGIPFDINGRVSGLSLMTEVLPGFGPAVQLPAAALLPETPDWNWARKIITPFGEQDYSGGILESFLPGYARNIAQFFKKGDPRLFANTVGAVQDYLVSTGDYDLTDPEEMKRLVDDSKETARGAYLLRGLIQFGAPTAPMPEFLVATKDGDLDVARVVLADFYKMQEEDYDSAVGRFLEKYGKDAFQLVQPKSGAKSPMLPTSKKSAEWVQKNGGVVDDYNLEYVRQFKKGERYTIEPEQRVSLAQARVGRWLYDQAQSKVSEKPTKVEREWLAVVKQKIQAEYPGYGQMVPGVPGKATTEQIVAQLDRAVDDPRLKDTDEAKAISLYLEGRRRALAWANEIGVKTLGAQAAQPARQWLGQVGQRLARKYPGFQQTFDTVFSQEVE
jgi:hypothetical protein